LQNHNFEHLLSWTSINLGVSRIIDLSSNPREFRFRIQSQPKPNNRNLCHFQHNKRYCDRNCLPHIQNWENTIAIIAIFTWKKASWLPRTTDRRFPSLSEQIDNYLSILYISTVTSEFILGFGFPRKEWKPNVRPWIHLLWVTLPWNSVCWISSISWRISGRVSGCYRRTLRSRTCSRLVSGDPVIEIGIMRRRLPIVWVGDLHVTPSAPLNILSSIESVGSVSELCFSVLREFVSAREGILIKIISRNTWTLPDSSAKHSLQFLAPAIVHSLRCMYSSVGNGRTL
jgi:hypothetical protein